MTENINDSPIENLFSRLSYKIAPKLYELTDTEPNNITTVGLIANVFAVISLKEGSILSCIIFALIGQYMDNLDGYYARKFNKESLFGKIYDHLADNIKLLCLVLTFYFIYEPKISDLVINIFILLTIISNINFSIKIRLKKLNKKSYDVQLEPWNQFGKLLGNKSSLIFYSKFTRFFDDTSIFIYFLITLLFIHYS